MTRRTFDYTSSIMVQRPVDVVGSFLIDPANAGRWGLMSGTIKWREPGPLRVGSVAECVSVGGSSGRAYRRSWVVAELVPTDRLMLRSRFMDDQMDEWLPVLTELEYRWDSTSGLETVVSLRRRTRVEGPAGVAWEKTIGRLNHSSARRTLQRLKVVVEAPADP